MTRKSTYGQFCPVAKACEVFAERWTPLIVREMIVGSQRFSDIHRGVPLMSRTLLSKRLQELERSGVIERTDAGLYRLTAAGQDLGPIVMQLGQWGKQWMRSEVRQDELDAGLLMWDMRRRIDIQKLGDEKMVVHFLYPDAPIGRRKWWLVMSREEVDLCLIDPGVVPDLHVTSQLRTMTDVWMGDLSFGTALQSGHLKIEGPSKLRTRLPLLLRLNFFAEAERHLG
jgi:DNA-binding HxlR family transcriptional regulator